LNAKVTENIKLLEELKDPGLWDFKRFVVGLGIEI
jgi:hypothetical protein